MKWIPLFATQFLGVLNDNFLKNLICFVAVAWSADGDAATVITAASALMVLPYLFFAPLSGRLAQVYSKKKILQYAKLAEIPIMLLAVVGFYQHSISLCLFANFLMGLQSAIYSPSKYGLIRDVGGAKGLSFGTGTMELLTFVAVLVGTMLAGSVSDSLENKTLILSIAIVGIAIAGWISSKAVKATETQTVVNVKTVINPIRFLVKNYQWSRKYVKGLNSTILGLGAFWMIGSMLQMNLLVYCPQVLNLSNKTTSLIMAALAVGIGMGCWVAGVISRGRVEIGLTPIGGLGLSICLAIISFGSLSLTGFTIVLTLAAFFSGFFKVPLNAWIQERVEGRKLGDILAYSNLVVFSFILLSSGIFYLVNNAYGAIATFKVITVIAFLVTLITAIKIPAMLVRFIFFFIAHFTYKIKVIGEENIPNSTGALVISNHLSIMDSFLLVAAVPRMLRFVMMEQVYNLPILRSLFRKMNMIPISAKRNKETLMGFNQKCANEIRKGHVVCIFPEGQISRIGQILEFKKGMEHIATESNAPIIPIYMDGVAGSIFSYEKQEGKFVWPRLKLRRRRVTLSIGKPMPSTSSSFEVRNKMEELSVAAFRNRFKNKETLAYNFIAGVQKNSRNTIEIRGQKLTFKTLGNRAVRMAFQLKKELTNHQKIAIVANASVDAVVLNYALMLLGKTVINIDTNEKMHEVKQKIVLCGATVVFCAVKLSVDAVVQLQLTPQQGKEKSAFRVLRCIPKRLLLQLLRNSNKIDDTCIINMQRADDKLLIPLTSRNILASIKGIDDLYHSTSADKLLCTLPLYSGHGLVFNLWLPIVLGISVVHSGASHPTILIGPNTDLEPIIQKIDAKRMQEVKFISTGLKPLNDTILKGLGAKTVVSRSLGLPECNSLVSINRSDYIGKDLSGGKIIQRGVDSESVGRPIPGTAIKVIDLNSGKELEPEQQGVLVIKSNALTEGYLDRTDSEFDRFIDGWFVSDIVGTKSKAGFITISK
ncbi:MAG: MFS transporter [Flavobacteriales bacterium]|nr:MFS transporter [Flavobacteriales bacterium]